MIYLYLGICIANYQIGIRVTGVCNFVRVEFADAFSLNNMRVQRSTSLKQAMAFDSRPTLIL